MALALILHRVNDFDTFAEVYNSIASMQAAGDVAAESVHRMSGEPDNILVIGRVDSLDTARAFFANPGLRNAMVRGGVKGEPRIEFFD